MEDKVVKPGLYAYQFRVDLPIDSGLTKVVEFCQKYNVKHYIIGAEVSSLGKPHFQCILWFESKINTSKLRNWWKGKTAKTEQPVSLTSAKKIKNLAKYAMKDKNFTTNLTKEELKLIGKWSPKVKAAEWSQLLDDYAKKFHEQSDEIDSYHDQGYQASYNNARLFAFLSYMLDFYKCNDKRPSRATLQYLAWKHGHMTNNYLIQKWF